MFADHQCVYCSVHKINFLCKPNIEIISLGKHSHRRSSTFVLSCSVHNINGSIMSVAVLRKSMNCKLERRRSEHKIDCATSQILNVCTLMFCAKPILRSYRWASIQSFMMRHIADHQRLYSLILCIRSMEVLCMWLYRRNPWTCKLERRRGEHKIDCTTLQIVHVCTLMFCAKPTLRSYRWASIHSFMMRHIADHVVGQAFNHS